MLADSLTLPDLPVARAVTSLPAFEAVYEEWYDQVVRWVRALGGPGADVEDVTQEVFIIVHRKLGGFDGGNLGGWLYRIAARTVRDYRRKAWFRRLTLRARVPEDEPARAMPAASERAEPAEQLDAQRRLHRLMAGLSPKLREPFVLFEIEGYDGERIAALLGIPEATVWSRLRLARERFLKQMERAEEDEP